MSEKGDGVLVFRSDSVNAKTQQPCGFAVVTLCFLSIDGYSGTYIVPHLPIDAGFLVGNLVLSKAGENGA